MADDKKRIPCPQCGNQLRVFAEAMGTEVRCPKCNTPFVVGRPREQAAPSTRPAASKPAATKSSAVSKPAPKPVPAQPVQAQPVASRPVAAEAAIDESYAPAIPTKPAKIVPLESVPLAPVQLVNSAPLPADDAYEPEVPLTPLTGEGEPVLESAGHDQDDAYEVDWESVKELKTEAPLATREYTPELTAEESRRRGMIRREEPSRSDAPRFTFFSGVFGYPWSGANIGRWAGMSFGLVCLGLAAVQAATQFGAFGPGGNVVMGMLLIMFTILLALATLSYCASCTQAAIQDTADGHMLPQDDMPEWDLWIFSFLAMLGLWVTAGAVGYPLTFVIGPVACVISSQILFPILLLSAMEAGSYVLPYSPPVLRTLKTYLHGWLTFYLLTMAIVGAWLVAFEYLFAQGPSLAVILGGPALAAVMLWYGRLLGRVAWKASGAPPAPMPDSDRQSAASTGSSPPDNKRRKKSRVRIMVPDEVSPEDRGDEPPRPRVSFHHRS